MNTNDFLNFVGKSNNPQQLMINVLYQMAGYSPMGQNLLSLAKAGNTQEIEKIARNMAQARGIDYDKEFSAFKQMFMRR